MADAIKRFGGNPAKLKSARLNPKNLLGYVEVHIEQGPVLEQKNLAVGIVTAIAGQSRFQISFAGRAGHAGTVPMDLRRDALCAAAEFIVAVENFARKTNGLVATVGQIHVEPGASNVIPGTGHADARRAAPQGFSPARQLCGDCRKLAAADCRSAQNEGCLASPFNKQLPFPVRRNFLSG